MTIAKEIKKKIDKLYVATGIMDMEIPKYLKDGKIEDGEKTVNIPVEFKLSIDNRVGFFLYEDNSILFVDDFSCVTALKD